MKSFLQNAWFPSMFIWHIMRWWNDAVDTEQALSILLHTQPNINIFILIFIIIKIINVIKKINNQIINVIIIVMMIVLIIIVIMTIMIIMIRVMLVTWLSKVGCKTASGTWRRRGAELPYIVIIMIIIITIHCHHHHHHTLPSSSSSATSSSSGMKCTWLKKGNIGQCPKRKEKLLEDFLNITC